MSVSPEILAMQQAYAARPWACRLRDSHCSSTQRFHTFDDAFAYMQYQVARWVAEAKQPKRYDCWRALDMRESAIIGPDGRAIPWMYWTMLRTVEPGRPIA